MGDGTGTNESKNTPHVFQVGSLVEFVGLNYTPDFIMMDERHEALGVVLSCYRDGMMYRYDMYTVYWFKLGKISQVASEHLKLVSL
tara:strand:+ start:856 stop:1113 length:258 start_codon:yes stop_codon:yes gene_type:complete